MIELGSLKRQNRKFKITLLLSYILFATLILGGIYLLHVKYSASESIKNFEEEVKTEASYKQNFYNEFYKKKAATVNALSKNEILLGFIENKKHDYKNVHSLFKTLMQSNANYMQLRYIDKDGQEIIRLDRKEIGNEPVLVKKENLQNKSARYYYKACCAINKDEVWFSKIDLNIEHNVIEKPIKPVLRVAQQIHINSSFEGFIIINIFMKPYLKTLTESSVFDVYLVDKNGYFLIHKNRDKNWSQYLGNAHNITDELKITKKAVKSKSKEFNTQNRYFLQPLSYGDYQDYRLVYFENAKKIAKTRALVKERVLFTILYAILIAIPFAYIASSPAKKIYQSLYTKSNDITELANNLEKRVDEEIEKNRIKDRILENQAKLAALGEMIGNIAHQWRHPITRVSLILQNMKTFKSLGKLSDEQFDKYISSTLEQMDYMSQTIDDFKNFYIPDREISTFNVKQSIKDTYKIIGASIKHEGIKIIIDVQDDFSIKGYKNQFSQVILNIMHNAREALEETGVKSPYIKIRLFCENSTNKVTIEDNAGGIKEANVDKVFDAYFTTKPKSGTGIGLYMSRVIVVENFMGSLHVKNTPEGALFTIEVPMIG
jgi:signal transduction histidine kinase